MKYIGLGLRPRLHDVHIAADEGPLDILGAPECLLQSAPHLGQLLAHRCSPLLIRRQRLHNTLNSPQHDIHLIFVHSSNRTSNP